MGSVVIDLTPDQERRLEELARERGLDVVDLVQNALQTLTAPAPEVTIPAASLHQIPIWEKLAIIADQVSDEDLGDGPTDTAEQHDHYIYGLPKKS